MSENETHAARLTDLSEARRWLKRYQHDDSRDRSERRWIAVASRNDHGRYREEVNRLRPETIVRDDIGFYTRLHSLPVKLYNFDTLLAV